MEEIDYVGGDELVFNNNGEDGIYSGGFSVNSIMMKGGMSPIITVNSLQSGGSKVSDLFNNLVIPNWALSYHNRLTGGDYNVKKGYENEYDDDAEEYDEIDDDLHDKLLELVKEDERVLVNNIRKKRPTRRFKLTKAGTKRNRKSGV